MGRAVGAPGPCQAALVRVHRVGGSLGSRYPAPRWNPPKTSGNPFCITRDENSPRWKPMGWIVQRGRSQHPEDSRHESNGVRHSIGLSRRPRGTSDESQLRFPGSKSIARSASRPIPWILRAPLPEKLPRVQPVLPWDVRPWPPVGRPGTTGESSPGRRRGNSQDAGRERSPTRPEAAPLDGILGVPGGCGLRPTEGSIRGRTLVQPRGVDGIQLGIRTGLAAVGQDGRRAPLPDFRMTVGKG